MSNTPKPCSGCGKPWWDGWEKCPHCGATGSAGTQAKQSHQSAAGVMGCLGVALIVVIIFMALSSGPRSGSAPKAPTHDAAGAWTACQGFVERRLKAPRTAKFPWVYSDKVTHQGAGRYRALAYVDAQNAFGAMLRTNFDCTVQWEAGGSWRLEDLTTD